jgi:hypothetical protein
LTLTLSAPMAATGGLAASYRPSPGRVRRVDRSGRPATSGLAPFSRAVRGDRPGRARGRRPHHRAEAARERHRLQRPRRSRRPPGGLAARSPAGHPRRRRVARAGIGPDPARPADRGGAPGPLRAAAPVALGRAAAVPGLRQPGIPARLQRLAGAAEALPSRLCLRCRPRPRWRLAGAGRPDRRAGRQRLAAGEPGRAEPGAGRALPGKRRQAGRQLLRPAAGRAAGGGPGRGRADRRALDRCG